MRKEAHKKFHHWFLKSIVRDKICRTLLSILNITEMAIGAWKAEVKRHLAEVRDQILNGPVPAGTSRRQHRMAILT